MVKILHIIHGLSIGGAETFIYNLLSGIDNSQFRFDFAIQNPQIKHIKLKSFIEKKHGHIYVVPEFTNSPIAQYRALMRILATGYDCVHIHMNAFVNPIPAIAAAKFPNKVIIHSHSTKNNSGGKIARQVHRVNKFLFLREKFVCLACSDIAGRWMYGHRTYKIVNNAVELDRFKFSLPSRKQLRSQLGFNDEFVIGHVGRFVEPKNHKFLLKIFANYRRKYPADNAQLVLVGDGPLFESIKALAEELEIVNSVHFIGSVDNPEKYYNVFDCFLFPSLFEGLAFVAIEAQACGLPIIASDSVTKEIDVSGVTKFVPLTADLDEWSDAVNQAHDISRDTISSTLIDSKFDSRALIKIMTAIYQ